jgi:transcriptional regulator with XRE-family HTH domain
MKKRGSATTDELLRDYEIGEKVRALRMRKKMGLVELGEHTGLSPGLLSKIENSRFFPPLQTLLRIALAFGVGLDHFFTDEAGRHVVAVVRKEERQRFSQVTKDGSPSFHFESLDFPANNRKMSAYLAEFEQECAEGAEPHEHEGGELIFVMSGKLGLRIGRKEYALSAEDSIYFDSSVPHSYRRIGRRSSRAIVVTAM